MKIKLLLLIGFFSVSSFLFTSPLPKNHLTKNIQIVDKKTRLDSLEQILDSIEKFRNDAIEPYVEKIKNTSKSITEEQKKLEETLLYVDSVSNRHDSLGSNFVLK
jgi:hypothetical protein